MKKCTILNSDTFEDHRGTVFSYYDFDEKFVEYNLMITKKGDKRGFHYHPEFTEYMMVVEGTCLFREYADEITEITLNVGDSIRIPQGTPHTFIALTDYKFVSMLTKKWIDCNPPIIKVDDSGNKITSK